MSGRRSVWLIVAASLVPLLLFAVFQVGYAAREQRRGLEARALNVADKLVLAADAETTRYAVLLDALATSHALRDGEWQQLLERFADFRAFNPDLRGLTVEDGSGRLLASGGLPIVRATMIADGRAAARPMFTGYVRTGPCRCLMFERAATSGDGRRVVLTLLTDGDLFERLLRPTRDEFAVSALNGPKARFVARSVDHDMRFGQMSSTFLQQAVASGQGDGIYHGQTLEGIENYSAFARSERTGWTAHVALGSDYIDNPARKFLASLMVAGLLSLVLAGLLIMFAVRQMREARRFAERLQQAQKMEALGQLTGGLAHDFNNLLTPVIGTLDLLSKRDGLDERGRKLARGALASAERAAKLTGQLLAFSRRQRLTVVPVDVRRLVDEVSALIERSLGARNPLVVSVAADVRCAITDHNQLEVALLNLALNARDASPEGATVSLDVVLEGDKWVRFTVADEGSGMDEETRRRALEPFFTTKATGKGTGLGLAQVFGVVEQSGGTIDMDSAPGAGTRVVLRLPACAEEAIAVDGAKRREAEPVRSLKLLVVDDDAAVRATIAGLLMEDGHAVEAVASGGAALAALEQEPADLVVVDYLMPGMTGAELIAAVRETNARVPFLLVTGFADTEAVAKMAEGVPILAKPFTPDRLRTAIREAVSRPAG